MHRRVVPILAEKEEDFSIAVTAIRAGNAAGLSGVAQPPPAVGNGSLSCSQARALVPHTHSPSGFVQARGIARAAPPREADADELCPRCVCTVTAQLVRKQRRPGGL